ncbi:cytochrome P450 [Streptomyces yaizuensis]|uniref:Cytochrome P450 n=1 Tax=Streptomyces yaizuensis TaxID=2989713 RepID=A0ABQ5NXN3_9ACTN|nr:cytochrome P450 [Streptomyces sp. YSPA8]GLF95130.1 cytochrome P450 [Streptomyces sp. YSPA8]
MVLPSGLNAWLVTDYALARELSVDPRLTMDIRRLTRLPDGLGHDRCPLGRPALHRRHWLNTDGTEHRALRKLIAPVFTEHSLASQQAMTETVVEQALNDIATRDRVDLITHYARRVAVAVMDHLLGVPAALRERHPEAAPEVALLGEPLGEQRRAARGERTQIMQELIDLRRADPGDDIVSHLLRSRAHRDDLTLFTIHGMLCLLFTAGVENTTTLIAHGAALLLRSPDARRALLSSEETARGVVEELLRHHPLTTGTWHFSTASIPAGTATIPADSCVLFCLPSANRDPDVFPDPDRLDPRRTNAGAHLSFGHGRHYCPGAPLARLEGRIALRSLLHRFPSLRLATPPEHLTWQGIHLNRRYATLPVLPGPERKSP